jgi:hypothetical protein
MIRKLKKYQQGGSFRDQLFPENKPVVDQGNFSKVKYTPAQKAAMQNANLVRKNEEKKKLQDEIAARQSKEKGTPYKLPTGVTKKYKDMTLKERAYVDAQSLRNKGRWNENQVEQPFLNTFNPITMLYDMAAGLGEAPLMSDVTNSYMPYVTGVVAPLAVGAFAGIGAKTTGQFVNNLTNPLAGTGQIIDNIGNKYLPNAYKYNPWAFKPNPEAYYRGVGKEGIKDALESRVIKSRDQDLFPSPYFARPNEFKTALYYNPDALIEAKGIDVLQVKNIEPNQIIFNNKDAGAVPLNPEWVDEVYLGNITPGVKTSQLGHLPIDDPNIRLLQKDWLRGYKEVPKPKIYSKGQPTQQSILNNLNESFPKPLTSEELDRFYDKYVPKLKETSQFIQEQGIRELKDFTSEEGQRRARLALLKINPTLSETEINHLLKNQITELENAYKYNMQEYMLRRPGKWVGNTDEHIDFFNSNYPTNNAFAWRNPKFFTELTNKPGSIENNIIPRNLFVNPSTSNIPISKHYNSQTFIDGQRHLLDPNLTIPTISLGQTNKLKSTFDHETAHLLQRSGLHPTDIELQKLAKEDFFQNIWLKYKKKTMSPRDYNNSIEYFYNPSKNNPLRYFPNEGYAFAREARRSMIDKGILNDTFDKVTPFKLLKHTLTKEVNDPIVGLANNKRLTTVFPFWKWGKLSKIINNMNTVAPIIGGAGLLGAGALQQQKKGGPIITNRGQWDYPGQTTIIPSNQITMQGVPYPVLGVDNIGHSKLMQPGRNYTFPGQYVTEYPIMQKGGVLKDPTMESLSNVYAQRNRNLPWVDRALNPQNYPINNQQEFMDKGQPMTHQLNWGEDADYMKFYVYPNIGYSQGNLEWNNNQQSIEFKSKKMAEYFSKNGLIKHYQQGGSTKQNPPKMWLQNDVDINYWNNMKKKYPTMIGIDPNHVDKYNNHLPIFANINTFVHPKTNLKRLKMVAPTLINPKIIPHGELIPVPQMQLKQQGNIPFYGPGNTIIGYTDDNRQFYPAQQYTGAPNNASNLQDKYLLENPDALRQYVSKLDNYRFQNEDIKKYPQGGSTKQNPSKVYTDPILYNKAAKMYNDSLALYNMSKLQYDMLNKKGLVGKKQLPVSANNSIDIINNDDMDMTDKDIYNKLKTLKTNNIKLSKTNSPDFSHPYIKPTTMYGEETKGRNKDRFGLIQSVLNTDSSPTFNYFYDTFPKQPVVYKPQPSQQKSKITNNKELLNVKLPSGDVPRYANGQPVYIKQIPEVIIQGTKNGKVYTDKKQFEQAQRLYNDSLNLFNLSTKHTQLYNNIAKTSKTDKEFTERIGFSPRGHFGNLPDTEFNRLETKLNKEMIKHPSWQPITKGKLPISHYADGIRREHATTWEYKKPISPPIYKGPTHPIQKMSRLKSVPYPMDNTDVSLQAQGVQVPMPSIPQQQGNPIYGPGNTIIGYSNNMHFTPALQYTGAPNNASNLQDKYLLENPDALRQYVSKLDNYRFDKGGVYSQALNNTVNGLNQLSYFSKNSPDNAMRDYYMNMSNYDSNNQDLYSTNQDLYGNTYFDEGGSYEELSNEYNDLSELQAIASMDGDNELYEYLAPQISSVQKSLTSLEELAKYDVIKEELQRQILQQPQFQEPSIEGYNPRRPFTSNYESTYSEPMMLGTKNNPMMLGTKIYPNMKLKGSPRNVKAYLTQKGLSRNAIAGIMGNIEHESSFNPGIGGDQGTSFGLFQHHAKRKDNLLSYLKKRNLDKTSIEGQIDFALSEYPQLIQKLNKAVSPQQAADIWVREFEKPANVEKQSKLRQRAALKYMKQGGTLPFLKQYK